MNKEERKTDVKILLKAQNFNLSMHESYYTSSRFKIFSPFFMAAVTFNGSSIKYFCDDFDKPIKPAVYIPFDKNMF